MNKILTIIVFILLIQKAYTLYVHTYKSGINWFDANKKCTEMGGNLLHDNFTLSVLDQEVWIGIIKYNELTPWIKLVGCYYYSNEVTTTSDINSVGYCQFLCKSWPYFSYQDSIKDCQCLQGDELTNLHKTKFSDCRRGHSRNDITMIYESLDLDGQNDENLLCIASSCNSLEIQRLPRTCTNTKSDVQVICDDLHHPENQWTSNFTMAQDECFKKNKNLLSPYHCFHDIGKWSWTNAFREFIAVKHFNETPSDMQPVGCLSGRKNSDSKDIDILERSCDDLLHGFICTSPSHLGEDNEEKGASGQYIIIGAMVGGIIGGVLTIVVATLFLVWIRRRKNQTTKSEGVLSNTDRSESSNVNQVSNMQYGLVYDNKASAPEYAVIKKANKLQNKSTPEYAVVQKEIKSSPEETYRVAPEGEYDKLNNILSRRKSTEPDVYGFAGQCEEGEYDSMKTVSAFDVNRADNLYDTNASICSGNND